MKNTKKYNFWQLILAVVVGGALVFAGTMIADKDGAVDEETELVPLHTSAEEVEDSEEEVELIDYSVFEEKFNEIEKDYDDLVERVDNVNTVLGDAKSEMSAKIEENYNNLDTEIKRILRGGGVRWNLVMVSDRPPMVERRKNASLIKQLISIADDWDIPLGSESSLWPSVAGLVPIKASVVCGLGPVAIDLYTSREAVSRISVVQRTLLLAQFLLSQTEK